MTDLPRCDNCMSINLIESCIKWRVDGQRSHYYVQCQDCDAEQKIYVETQEEFDAEDLTNKIE